jgi:acetylornithine deacetylase/succinyl-diaminopimelate desuccinylase-like protein
VRLLATSASAQVRVPALQDEAVAWFQSYLRVDTINPPGNEAAGVQFFKKIFDAEGISYDTVESAPGRGNIWARLEGGDQPALMLLHHMDVVPANKASWLTDPLSGEIRDDMSTAAVHSTRSRAGSCTWRHLLRSIDRRRR